jgi:flagellar L-ring protein precursor FlgH
MTIAGAAACALLMLAGAEGARADSLYVAGPPPAAPGHPLRLGPDHRASQVGDLVVVAFNFSMTSSSADSVASKKDYSLGLNGGSGPLFLGGLFRLPTSAGAKNSSDSSHTRSNTTAFTSTMMATVTNVLPSGALQIAGSQTLAVDGRARNLRVTGTIRPDDIDNTDTIVSSKVADVQASFDGNYENEKKGIIRRILDVLF